ncbi:MAG: CRISPR-associated helicase/endonuclease Cas3, partial [Stackebrandtia sp.]
SLHQAAGRANREGHLAVGTVVVFDAVDMPVPGFYRPGIAVTRLYFGPGLGDPDDLDALGRYYRHLYASLNIERGERATMIQKARRKLDFVAVADGPLGDPAGVTRDPRLAFRMIDDDTVPVVITDYIAVGTDADHVERLLAQLADASGPRREVFRALAPYTASLPRRIVDQLPESMCPTVIGDLRRWNGPDYDEDLGIVEDLELETIW